MRETCYWVFCFVPSDINLANKIFGFSEFLTVVALLTVVYTIADVSYKFRIAVTPGSLYTSTFGIVTIIGLETLLTEIWIAEGWWVPVTAGITYALWQGIFGLLFLCTFLTWMYYAFIRPPIFGKRNAYHFGWELCRYIRRGNDDELKIIASELTRSAKTLILHSACLPRKHKVEEELGTENKKNLRVENYANDILSLIADRRFCRQIVVSSPVTAQAFFEGLVESKKFDIPIGSFIYNISSEAIAQKSSFLYIETGGYISSLLGYIKPVSRAVYGNFPLVEALAHKMMSPLDIHYTKQQAWDAEQWEAYCRAALIMFQGFLEGNLKLEHSFAVHHVFTSIEYSFLDTYKLDGIPEVHGNESYERLCVAVKFVKDLVDLINKQMNPQKQIHLANMRPRSQNIYDYIATLIFNICFASSSVRSPRNTSWGLQHNLVWNGILGGVGSEGMAWRIVRHKVRRLLYNEIAQLSECPNYQGANILGFCLQVLGLKLRAKTGRRGRETYALTKVVLSWTRKGYLRLLEEFPDVAASVLMGSISYDTAGKRLVKTYTKGLSQETPKDYLDLEQPIEGARGNVPEDPQTV